MVLHSQLSYISPLSQALADWVADMQNEEHNAAVTHQRKASNVYGVQGPPQKSPRIWKLAPNTGHPGATTVLPHEAVSLLPFLCAAMQTQCCC